MNSVQPTPHKPRLIILKHFYKLRAAEHELVVRLSASAEELGWDVRVFEVDATIKPKQIYEAEKGVDLVLDIHYEFPKFMLPKSIGAFWTPTSFMKDWDLGYVWENQLSHDEIVYPDSPEVLKLLHLFRGNQEFHVLNHSLPGSWLTWISDQQRNDTPKAYYAGINWNKLSGRPGRHHKLFKILDQSELLAIYGPQKIEHIKPWAGFKSYMGQIPFDGRSLFTTARSHGISLVLSANQHIEEGVMSSRLFEGLAAGNVIISDGHPFTKRYLGGNAFYLDLERGDERTSKQLQEIILCLREDSKKRQELQDLSHQIFLEKFDLTKQLKKILVKPTQEPANSEVAILVQGNNKNNIRWRLSELGYKNIQFIKQSIRDIAELFEVARSLELSKFIVLNSQTEFMDSFNERLKSTLQKMEISGQSIGLLTTVCLKQGTSAFAPVVIGATKVIPINGIIINMANLSSDLGVCADQIPSLRLEKYSQLSYVSIFANTYELLEDIGKSIHEKDQLRSIQNSQLRFMVRNKLEKDYFETAGDVTEEVRQLSRGRKRLLILLLLSSLPFFRPFVAIYKKLFRIFRN